MTAWRYGDSLHQTSGTTAPDRYPGLFDALADRLPPDARILSFGCSTGEEFIALPAVGCANRDEFAVLASFLKSSAPIQPD